VLHPERSTPSKKIRHTATSTAWRWPGGPSLRNHYCPVRCGAPSRASLLLVSIKDTAASVIHQFSTKNYLQPTPSPSMLGFFAAGYSSRARGPSTGFARRRKKRTQTGSAKWAGITRPGEVSTSSSVTSATPTDTSTTAATIGPLGKLTQSPNAERALAQRKGNFENSFDRCLHPRICSRRMRKKWINAANREKQSSPVPFCISPTTTPHSGNCKSPRWPTPTAAGFERGVHGLGNNPAR